MKTRQLFVATGGWTPAVALLAAITLGLLAILLAQGPAKAHDHRIPDTTLIKGEEKRQNASKEQQAAPEKETMVVINEGG